jgi:hypothetical protein
MEITVFFARKKCCRYSAYPRLTLKMLTVKMNGKIAVEETAQPGSAPQRS